MPSLSNRQTCLLAIDAGTTHCKAALFDLAGNCIRESSVPTPSSVAPGGYHFIDPAVFWSTIHQAVTGLDLTSLPIIVAGIGVASPAESGLLVDRISRQPLSPIIPWFDTTAEEEVATIRQAGGEQERFLVSGIYPSFKCSLAKILWIRHHLETNFQTATWLSIADFIAYRLAGIFSTDYSLAGRTYAFNIVDKVWDKDWLREFGLSPSLFPPAFQAGMPVGHLLAEQAATFSLPVGIPVSIAGHDHICASLAAGAFHPGVVLDSMGTAEAMVGVYPERPLGIEDYLSGFSIGCHVVPGQFYWIGGLSSSGGAIEWMRHLVSENSLSYADLDGLLATAPDEPGDILFFPYLAGAGSPHSDPSLRGAFVGMRLDHQLPDLVKAILEGTAYEMEFIRRQGEKLTGLPIGRLVATGGGIRNPRWMQIKADVCGCRYELAQTSEAVLLGAAAITGIAAKLYTGVEDAFNAISHPTGDIFMPDEKRHTRYMLKFENGFLRMRQPLRDYSRNQ